MDKNQYTKVNVGWEDVAVRNGQAWSDAEARNDDLVQQLDDLHRTLNTFRQICPEHHPYLFATIDFKELDMECPACGAE